MTLNQFALIFKSKSQLPLSSTCSNCRNCLIHFYKADFKTSWIFTLLFYGPYASPALHLKKE